MQKHPIENKKNNMIGSKRGRFGLVIGTMIVMMVLTTPAATFYPFIWFVFPIGLINAIRAIFNIITGQRMLTALSALDFGAIALGWLIYLSVSIPAILAQKRTNFFVLYTILIILLVTNLAGCQLIPSGVDGPQYC